MAALLPIVAWHAYTATVTSSPEYGHPAYAYQRAPYQYSHVTYPENTAGQPIRAGARTYATQASLFRIALSALAVMASREAFRARASSIAKPSVFRLHVALLALLIPLYVYVNLYSASAMVVSDDTIACLRPYPATRDGSCLHYLHRCSSPTAIRGIFGSLAIAS